MFMQSHKLMKLESGFELGVPSEQAWLAGCELGAVIVPTPQMRALTLPDSKQGAGLTS